MFSRSGVGDDPISSSRSLLTRPSGRDFFGAPVNCKQGDLALIIRGVDAGKEVTCLEVATPILPDGRQPYVDVVCWRIDREVKWRATRNKPVFFMRYCPDNALMPINGTDDHTKEHTRDLESVQ